LSSRCFIKEKKIKLGLMALFPSLFGTSLVVLTEGRRVNIILATISESFQKDRRGE